MRPRVFVSHSNLDNEFTERLVADLKAAGADVWVDYEQIASGDFAQSINEGLGKCDWVLLVQTPNALASEWVRGEINAAVNLKHKKRIRDVIPVVAASCPPNDVPPMWDVLHNYDATKDYARAVKGLIRALGIQTTESRKPTREGAHSKESAAPRVAHTGTARQSNGYATVAEYPPPVVRYSSPEEERRIEELAFTAVTDRGSPSLRDLPTASFGHLLAVGQSEVESCEALRYRIEHYVAQERPTRPLSVAVFAPYGTGKEFAVMQVARTVTMHLERIEFDVSLFKSVADLFSALHSVRDKALEGKLPLVFFNEFDSGSIGELGWLKYFLAPMQDGVFVDGGITHHVGKAVFVFTAGSCATMSAFVGSECFEDARGPDFTSRLHAYMDIPGLNPSSVDDKYYILRRAFLLSSILTMRASTLFDERKRCRIDPNVLRAFLKVPCYRHNARSMVAILEMCALDGRQVFDSSALPPRLLLSMHTDLDIFYSLAQPSPTDSDLSENGESKGQ